MKLSIMGLSALLVLSGCAVAPASIAPSYVSVVPYQSYTCKQLGEESIHLEQALATASKQQSDARTGDTVGVLLLGIPTSTLSGGNIAPQIAQLKGEQEAVRQVTIAKNCKG